MTEEDLEELYKLRNLFNLCSLGDRPIAPAVAKIKRLAQLEAEKTLEQDRFSDKKELKSD
jgi:hypothetical protein